VTLSISRAAGRERDVLDRAAVAFELLDAAARGRLPEPDGPVGQCRSHLRAAGRERNGIDRAIMLECLQAGVPFHFHKQLRQSAMRNRARCTERTT